jgi:hypothetical protein
MHHSRLLDVDLDSVFIALGFGQRQVKDAVVVVGLDSITLNLGVDGNDTLEPPVVQLAALVGAVAILRFALALAANGNSAIANFDIQVVGIDAGHL